MLSAAKWRRTSNVKRAAVGSDDASKQSVVKGTAKNQGEQDQQGEANRLMVPGIAEAEYRHSTPNQACADEEEHKEGQNPKRNPPRLESPCVEGRLSCFVTHRLLALWLGERPRSGTGYQRRAFDCGLKVAAPLIISTRRG